MPTVGSVTVDGECREVLHELETYLDGECPDRVEAVVARHLADCEPCLNRSDFERSLRAIVARHCREAAPGDLVDRILGQLA